MWRKEPWFAGSQRLVIPADFADTPVKPLSA
jgi:hypothetical protein